MFTLREASYFLEKIAFFLLIISNLFFSLIILKHWKTRVRDILLIIIYPLICSVSVILFANIGNEPSVYVALFISNMLSLIFLLKINLEESIFLSIFQLFHMMLVKGISAGILSMILKKNMYQLFQSALAEQIIMCFAHAILATIFCFYYIFFKKEKISTFILCKGQVYYVTIIHLVITLYLLFNCYNYYFNLDFIWFSIDQVFTCISLYAVYLLVLKYGVKVSNLLQNEIRLKNQNFKILIQSANFNALPNEIKVKTNICNSEVINSLFAEFKNICNFKNIDLSIRGIYSENINIPEKEMHEIFSNLLKNSLEAVLKIKDENEMKIDVNFENEDNFFKISISNTYYKKPLITNGYFETSKKYTEVEGLGIGYVKQVLNTYKGKGVFKINSKEKTFNVILFIKLKN